MKEKNIIFHYSACLIDYPPKNLKNVLSFRKSDVGIFDLRKDDCPVYLLDKTSCYQSFYKVKMLITAHMKRDWLHSLNRVPEYGDVLSFNADINFADFEDIKAKERMKEFKIKCKDGDNLDNYFSLDEEKLLKTFIPEKLKEVKERLTRFLIGVVPEPCIVQDKKEDEPNKEAVEFLEFTKDSAIHWAGPHEFNGKLGAYAQLSDRGQTAAYDIINPATDWEAFSIPYNYKNKFLKKYNIEDANMLNAVWAWTKEQKSFAWDQFPTYVKQKLYSNLIKGKAADEDVFFQLPFRIFLYGTDDCSYTAYFDTKENAEKELKYLRKMQPLCFCRDITNRDYIFTN